MDVELASSHNRQERTPQSRRSGSSDDVWSEEVLSDSQSRGQQQEHSKLRRKKAREQTKSACLRCKKRKGKCSGERPTCAYCRRRNVDCQYDVRVGSSRRAELELKLNEANSKSHELGILLHMLQSGSDEESTMVLARLRMGESLDSVVNTLLPQGDMTNPDSQEEAKVEHQYFPGSGDDSSLENMPLTTDTDNTTTPMSDSTSISIRSSVQSLFDRNQWANPIPIRNTRVVRSGSSSEEFSLYGKSDGSISNSSVEILSPFHKRMNPADMFLSQQEHLPCFKIDPNIGNSFGNLPFSSAILANHFPEEVQRGQMSNLTVPIWAMKVVNSEWDGTADQSISTFYDKMRSAVMTGSSTDALFGVHPLVGVLLDDQVYRRAPPLSQWAARMVKSIKGDDSEPDMTQFASIYHFWVVMRWMVYATPATYEAIPEFLRPTPYQLFKAHPMLFDFMTWPDMRDLCAKNQCLSTDTRWILELSRTITCCWSGAPSDTLCINKITGELDLSPEAKHHSYTFENWSVAPSIRGYLKDADAYLRVREVERYR